MYTRGCVYIHSTVSLLINGGSFSKEDENIFQKSARVVPVILVPQFQMEPREPIFEKCSHLRKKRGGADAFPRFVWWVVWAESPIRIIRLSATDSRMH